MKARVQVERRLVRRLAFNRPGMVIWDGARRSRCMIRDISAAGARVVLEATAVLPDRFNLSLTPDGKVARQCHVKWRANNHIGVAFESAETVAVPPPERDETTFSLDC